MSTGTMTSKGQITIPKDVRDQLGLSPGVVVTFTLTDDNSVVLSATPRRAVDLYGSISYTGPTVSLDEMDRAIAEGWSSRQ